MRSRKFTAFGAALLGFSWVGLLGSALGGETKVWRCDGEVRCERGSDVEDPACTYRDKTAYAETRKGAVKSLVDLCEAGYNVGPGGWSCKATTLDCEER